MEVAPPTAHIMASKTCKRKQGEKKDPTPTPPSTPINIRNNATCLQSTQSEVKSCIFSPPTSQWIPLLIQHGMSSTLTASRIMLVNTFVFNIISTPSQPMLIKTHKFVKQVTTHSLNISFT